MNCKECQHYILQGLTDKAQSHVQNCPVCREFLEAKKILEDLKPSLEPCPPHIRFETLMEAAKKEKSRSLPFTLKWALPLAAAFLFLLLYFPFWDTPRENVLSTGNFSRISFTISSEIEELERSIEDMELSMLSADTLIENEMEILIDEINDFNPEV